MIPRWRMLSGMLVFSVCVISMIDGMSLDRLTQPGALRDVAPKLNQQNRSLRDVELSSVKVDDDPIGPHVHQLTSLGGLRSIHAARHDRRGNLPCHSQGVPSEVNNAVLPDLVLHRSPLTGCLGTARQEKHNKH